MNNMKFTKKIILSSICMAAVSGCVSRLENVGKAPDMSNLEINDNNMPEAKTIQVPMPDAISQPSPKRADAASLWSTANKGFFGDKRASQVGDILTVFIDISDKASLSNQSQRSRSNSENVANPLLLGYEKRLVHCCPILLLRIFLLRV